jgi:hypothetical protein
MRDLIARTMYLCYYARETDREQLRRFATYVGREHSVAPATLYADVLRSVYQYNISVADYFFFRFWQRSAEDRETWAGTGYMYEYQRLMNPPRARRVLIDKVAFLEHFRPLARRHFAGIAELRRDPSAARGLLEDPSGRVVVKRADGQCGREVAVLETAGLNPDSLLAAMQRGGYDLAEGYVLQHRDLMALSPSALNTVRLITQLQRDGTVHVVGGRLRISVNSHVDNLAAGNMAAPLDVATGRVAGPAVFSDITRSCAEVHPVTGRHVLGFQVPFWEQAVETAREAARLSPETRSVGWDLALTDEGPELIEGNHDWCKLLWQLPAQRGLKADLEHFRNAER